MHERDAPVETSTQICLRDVLDGAVLVSSAVEELSAQVGAAKECKGKEGGSLGEVGDVDDGDVEPGVKSERRIFRRVRVCSEGGH